MNFKRLMIIVVIIAGSFYFVQRFQQIPGAGKSGPGIIKTIRNWRSKDAPYKKDLERLKLELKANEDLLGQIEAQIENLEANPPQCGGRDMELHITNDPRLKLQEDIDRLLEAIAQIEGQD
ncbi:MAG: hypothetical protein SV062_08840 [Thermodesulfobacteriota bacterium]|nr:hypothetical protein [Thermodesulfobacteriota bacterium]